MRSSRNHLQGILAKAKMKFYTYKYGRIWGAFDGITDLCLQYDLLLLLFLIRIQIFTRRAINFVP